MRPVRAWPFFVALAAAACSTPPIAGEYHGPERPRASDPANPGSEWVPAKLELLADGSCVWYPAMSLGPGPHNVFTPIGSWQVESERAGGDVVVVHPDKSDSSRMLTFHVAKADGETVLVAEDGSRLVRTH